MSSVYHWCFVPQCNSSSRNTPGKRFISVPKNMTIRKLWFRAAQRHDKNIPRGTSYCCEDHFNLEEDLENYKNFIKMKKRAKFKPGVLPHIFECHKNGGHNNGIQKNGHNNGVHKNGGHNSGVHKNGGQQSTTLQTRKGIDRPAQVMSEDGDPVNYAQSAAKLIGAQVATAVSANQVIRLRPILPKPAPQEQAAQNGDDHVKRKGMKQTILSLQEKMEVLERIDAGVSEKDICAEFHIKFKTFYDIKKNKKKIRADARTMQEPATATEVKKTKFTPSNHASLDAEVFRWYQKECATGVHVSGDDLQSAAARLAKQLNITDFKPSAGWLLRFWDQHCPADLEVTEKSNSADEAAVETFREELHGIFPTNQHAPATHTSAEVTTAIAPTEAVYIVERDTDRAPTEAVYIVEKDTDRGTLENEYIDLEENDPWDVNTPKEDPHSTPFVYSTPSQNAHNNEINDLQPRESWRETNTHDLPPLEQDADLHMEVRRELREIKDFMREMSSSMRSIKMAAKDISETLKVIAAARNGFR
ncbi:hypothetical protein O3P69_004783 [Scylla paramamosain]|uniref:HTH CENPB-type domain-containing protein n=1 Tax=Scylla paramamosain TaxID=85552 RepID=A0AAW0UB27_SCYPA